MKKSDTKLPSNKTFGLFFVFLTATAAAYVAYFSISTIAMGILVSLSIVLFTLGMLNSEILSGPNYLWMRIGELIGLVVSPLISAINIAIGLSHSKHYRQTQIAMYLW